MAARLVPLVEGVPTMVLQRPVLLIGRHPECDIRLNLPQISRRHCCLALAYDRLIVRDLGSRNGVRVNGRLVDEERLNPGDEVAIAHLLYRYEDSARAKTSTREKSRHPAEVAPVDRKASRPFDEGDLIGSEIDLIPLDD